MISAAATIVDKINKISAVIDKINRILFAIALVLVGVIAVVQFIKVAPKWWATITKEAKKASSGSLCSAKSGYVYCGYCDEDMILSGNPNAGKCFYCPKGTKCKGDVCGGLTCSGGGGTPGDGSSDGSSDQPSNYYILCWDCEGVRSVSYNGYDATTCGYYWNLCDIYQCRNMRRKCW